MTFKKFLFVFVSIFLLALVAGCSSGEAAEVNGAEQLITPIEQMDVPEGVKVIGLGEATHGNVELQELKKDVFEALIQSENARVFVIEGDFGGGQKINQFILDGKGSAKEAINALDFSIYKTEQMMNLIQWMHDYNTRASEEEKLYFYGNDMQRYNWSKKGLLDYFEGVNKDAAKKYEDQLKHVTNEAMRDLTSEQLAEVKKILDQIVSDLQSNRTAYIEKSSSDAFLLASQYARVIKQRTQLLLNEENYSQLRDQYLAENLKWIMEFEEGRGQDKIFFTGHNGHVEKTSASLAGYKSMGSYLDEWYGAEYFAIGTDVINSEFQAFNRGTEERQTHTIQNDNALVRAFQEVEPNIFYVGFDKARESEDLASIIKEEQKMVNIGDDFRSWYKFLKMFYTIEMVPEEAYDGVIIVKEATPTTVIK